MFKAFTKQGMRESRCNALHQACEATRYDANRDAGQFFWVQEMKADAVVSWTETWKPRTTREPPDGGWDWDEAYMARRGSHVDFLVALWHGNGTLCGLCLLTVARRAVRIEAIEGNPDPQHPLKQSVLPVLLDVAFRFAERLKKAELHIIEPAQGLLDLYRNVYLFDYVDDGKRRLCRKTVS